MKKELKILLYFIFNRYTTIKIYYYNEKNGKMSLEMRHI